MHLSQLELSGFKSFARATRLEFPRRVTAIVGPNGSGKSNVVEGIRWVLGEQSMKSLRGKRGEDLIWNGSPRAPRTGKAGVTLIFDNADGKIPLAFERVSISRKIFRDGTNEYYLNDSRVRLREVVELMARIGLGETKHNIINQGEVDRMLLATPRERRAMLEEALGLRVYQLKKNEAERKLDATEANMRQAEAVLREIAPHIKFLREQAKKAQAREALEADLRSLARVYCAREAQEIEEERAGLAAHTDPLRAREREIKREAERLRRAVAQAERAMSAASGGKAESREFFEQDARRRALERELGRWEGRLEVEREKIKQPKLRAVAMRDMESAIDASVKKMRSVLAEQVSLEIMRKELEALVMDWERLREQMERGMIEVERDAHEVAVMQELERSIEVLQRELAVLARDLEVWEAGRMQERDDMLVAQQRVRELDALLRQRQEEERDLAVLLERARFAHERVRLREQALGEELAIAKITREDIGDVSLESYEAISLPELKRKVEGLRVRFEEVGGIDPAVIAEHEEMMRRHEFLTKELGDLRNAATSLKELIKELDQHLKKDFREGFAKIKVEFHNYFRIIFGGGRATLQFESVAPQEVGDEADEPPIAGVASARESGIDISVDLPRKRIRGLAMLSGGERALTAIALLFAISAVNPPPFLVLDETDAALDEANSQRYAAILKELARHTQLILVTHNRETMKSAGILYGVTMGDDGVSKLLSLKLEQAEEYANR